MSPTNFGALPSNQAAPTGLCQIKRGVNPVAIVWTTANAVEPLQDGAGGYMRISITPPRAGWWIIRAETIWALGEAAWYYMHWGVRISPADALGATEDRNHHCLHSALGWTEQVINTAYRLNAATSYYAEMYWPCATNGGSWNYYTASVFHYIMGEFVEDGPL